MFKHTNHLLKHLVYNPVEGFPSEILEIGQEVRKGEIVMYMLSPFRQKNVIPIVSQVTGRIMNVHYKYKHLLDPYEPLYEVDDMSCTISVHEWKE